MDGATQSVVLEAAPGEGVRGRTLDVLAAGAVLPPRAWADSIRERLYLTAGRPTNQRPYDDPKHSYSLIS